MYVLCMSIDRRQFTQLCPYHGAQQVVYRAYTVQHSTVQYTFVPTNSVSLHTARNIFIYLLTYLHITHCRRTLLVQVVVPLSVSQKITDTLKTSMSVQNFKFQVFMSTSGLNYWCLTAGQHRTVNLCQSIREG